MRKLIPLLARVSPKFLTFCFTGYAMYQLNKVNFFQSINCFDVPHSHTCGITELLPKIIRIEEQNIGVIGQAFCFEDGLLVSGSRDLLDLKKDKKFDFFIGETKLKGNFKIIGHFENLTFFQIKGNDNIQPISHQTKPKQFQIQQVQVLQRRQFLAIRNGYKVCKDAGFTIISGKGFIGSLVINNGLASGIVTHIGRDSQQGFLRMIQWHELSTIARKLKNQNFSLGISAVNIEERDGISIVRIASHSAMENKIQIGDIITKANSQQIRNPEDLYRIFMLSKSTVTLQVERDNIVNQIQIIT